MLVVVSPKKLVDGYLFPLPTPHIDAESCLGSLLAALGVEGFSPALLN